MKRDNKKALYESIMASVAKEVKKALNEKIEQNTEEYKVYVKWLDIMNSYFHIKEEGSNIYDKNSIKLYILCNAFFNETDEDYKRRYMSSIMNVIASDEDIITSICNKNFNFEQFSPTICNELTKVKSNVGEYNTFEHFIKIYQRRVIKDSINETYFYEH